jgi:hypothetical protein
MLDYCLCLMDEVGESYYASVTLLVGGIIVSGKLIHPDAYHRADAKKLDSLATEPNSKIASMTIEEMIRDSAKGLEPSSQLQVESERDVIHLKDFKIFQSSTFVVFKDATIAIRVDAIDGFELGEHERTNS